MVAYRSREYAHQNIAVRWILIVTALILGALFAAGGMWASTDGSAAAWWLGGVTLAVVLAPLWTPLTITVDDTHVRVSLAGLMKKAIALDDIMGVEAREYRPIKDFGGWGWKWSHTLRNAVAYTVRGNTAVVLTVRGGGQVYLGVSDEPGLLETLSTRMNA